MINKLHFNTLVGAIILVLGSSPAMAESTYGYNSAGTSATMATSGPTNWPTVAWMKCAGSSRPDFRGVAIAR